MHGNSISIYYGIAISKEDFDKIKKLVSLEHKDLFNNILNGGNIEYIISGKIKWMINDKTDYCGKLISRVFTINKIDMEKLIKKCSIGEDKIDYIKIKNELNALDIYDYVEKDLESYIENFLVHDVRNPSFIKINDKNELIEYCSIDELSIEMEKSYNSIKELLELIKDHVDIVPNLFLYKYFY
jgi:hypothetical protein